jgi:hypothetical protein
MIEAANSVLQTAPAVRTVAEQASSNLESFAANPARTQKVVIQAPYVSPYIAIDTDYNRAVLQLRNGETGDVTDQYPSRSRLQELAQIAAREAAKQAATKAPSTGPKDEADSAQAFVQQQQSSSASTQSAPRSGAPTQQQIAAFQAAAQSGNANAGHDVTLTA